MAGREGRDTGESWSRGGLPGTVHTGGQRRRLRKGPPSDAEGVSKVAHSVPRPGAEGDAHPSPAQ
eukprot:13789212-Alexandrium_andersonii.AAC.1